MAGAPMDIGSLFFSFQGRINRARYWLAVLGYVIVDLIAYPVKLTLGSGFGYEAFSIAVGVAVMISGFAVATKRLHDRDKSAWWLLVFYALPAILAAVLFSMSISGEMPSSFVLLYLIPVAIWVWVWIELGCLPGTAGANRYGPDPLRY